MKTYPLKYLLVDWRWVSLLVYTVGIGVVGAIIESWEIG